MQPLRLVASFRSPLIVEPHLLITPDTWSDEIRQTPLRGSTCVVVATGVVPGVCGRESVQATLTSHPDTADAAQRIRNGSDRMSDSGGTWWFSRMQMTGHTGSILFVARRSVLVPGKCCHLACRDSSPPMAKSAGGVSGRIQGGQPHACRRPDSGSGKPPDRTSESTRGHVESLTEYTDEVGW